MGTIIGRLHTPVTEDQTRDIIHLETEIDAVIDPISGASLREQITDLQKKTKPADIDKGTPGLFTPEIYIKMTENTENLFVLSTAQPTFASSGYWCNIYDTNMTTVDT